MSGQPTKTLLFAACFTKRSSELKAMGKTLFIISHDDGYFEHADRLLLMKEGRLIELNAEERQRASKDAIAMLK